MVSTKKSGKIVCLDELVLDEPKASSYSQWHNMDKGNTIQELLER
jgi:hypothetical protein